MRVPFDNKRLKTGTESKRRNTKRYFQLFIEALQTIYTPNRTSQAGIQIIYL